MNIQTEAYQVTYDPNTTIITYSGSFRLHTPEYTKTPSFNRSSRLILLQNALMEAQGWDCR